MKISKQLKNLIEKNPMSLATVMPDGKPNVIGVAGVKVIDNNKLLITDNFMNQTAKDIQDNSNVCLVVWDKNENGFKLVGKARYFNKGKWVKTVKELPENEELPAKGAILVDIELTVKSA